MTIREAGGMSDQSCGGIKSLVNISQPLLHDLPKSILLRDSVVSHQGVDRR
jgi:hypothetical protein